MAWVTLATASSAQGRQSAGSLDADPWRQPSSTPTASQLVSRRLYYCNPLEREESLHAALVKIATAEGSFVTKGITGLYGPGLTGVRNKSTSEELNELEAISYAGPRGDTAEVIIDESWLLGKACIIWLMPGRIVSVSEVELPTDLAQAARYAIGVFAGARGQQASTNLPDAFAADKLRAFSNELFPPDLDLSSVNRILIRPGGITSQLPFLAFTYRGRRVGAEFAVVALTDLRGPGGLARSRIAYLPDGQQHDDAFERPLVVGNPELGWDTRTQWTPIPFSEQEATSVAGYFHTSALVGSDATRTAVMRRLWDADYIHISAHAITDAVNPMDGSFVVLSGGYLTGRMIQRSTLQFHRQPIVVLSNCQSALGKPFEGGTYGLARTFASKGAGQVVGNLWNVNDSASGQLMQSFAREIAAGQGGEFALRSVVRQAIIEDPNGISTWGSFMIYGYPSLDCTGCTDDLT